MDEDLLSPALGRLIDEAKTAASRADSASGPIESVALLLADQTIVSASAARTEAGPLSAAGLAFAELASSDEGAVAAAALVITGASAESVFPSEGTREALAAINPDIPLVVKQRGRWVVRPLSQVTAPLVVGRVLHPERDLLVELEAYDAEAFGRTGLRSYDLAVIVEAGALFVARLDDQIVAGSQLIRLLDEPDFLYVVGFYVRPQWQRRHIGRAFLASIAEESRKLGAGGLILTVSPDNIPAINLYENAGFVNERFIQGFYGEGEDRYILRWRFPERHLQGSV